MSAKVHTTAVDSSSAKSHGRLRQYLTHKWRNIVENRVVFTTFFFPLYLFMTCIGVKPYSLYVTCLCRRGQGRCARSSCLGMTVAVALMLCLSLLCLIGVSLMVSVYYISDKQLLSDGTIWGVQLVALLSVSLYNVGHNLLNVAGYRRLLKLVDGLRIEKAATRFSLIATVYVLMAASFYLPLHVHYIVGASSVNTTAHVNELVMKFVRFNQTDEEATSLAKSAYLLAETSLCFMLLSLSLSATAVCLFLAVCFKEHSRRFTAAAEKAEGSVGMPIGEFKRHFAEFCELVAVLNRADALLANVLCANVFSLILILCLQAYALFAHYTSAFVFPGYDSSATIMFFVQAFFFLLNWFALSVWPAIYLNEASREIKPILLVTFMDSAEQKQAKDQFLQTLENRDWGISMGHFFILDRAAFLTITGMVFTFLVLWIQFNTSSTTPNAD